MKSETLKNEDMMALIRDAMENNQKAIMRVQGSSMFPFLWHNKTNITLIPKEGMKKGDIILFKLNDRYRLHRIIKMKYPYLIAKGDALVSKEFLVADDVIGRVESYEINNKVRNPRSCSHKLLLIAWRLIKPLYAYPRRLYACIRKTDL